PVARHFHERRAQRVLRGIRRERSSDGAGRACASPWNPCSRKLADDAFSDVEHFAGSTRFASAPPVALPAAAATPTGSGRVFAGPRAWRFDARTVRAAFGFDPVLWLPRPDGP